VEGVRLRPKSGIKEKTGPDEGIKRAQRLLITWISEEPAIYSQLSDFISEKDFTLPLYKQVAAMLFEGLNDSSFEVASLISKFEAEEEQKEVASLFNTKMTGLDGHPLEMDSVIDREHALKDIVLKVKENSYEYYSKNLASDVNALNEVIQGKKQLEKLKKVTFRLEK